MEKIQNSLKLRNNIPVNHNYGATIYISLSDGLFFAAVIFLGPQIILILIKIKITH